MRISDWSSDVCSSDLISVGYAACHDHIHFQHQKIALARQTCKTLGDVPLRHQVVGQTTLHAQRAAEGVVHIAAGFSSRVAKSQREANALRFAKHLRLSVLLRSVNEVAGSLQEFGQLLDSKSL